MTDAFVHVVADAGAVSGAAREIGAIEEVSSVHVVTGDFDVVAQLDLNDPADLPEVVADKIHSVSGVVDTVTNVAFER